MPNSPLAGTLAMPTMTPRLSLISKSVPSLGLSSLGNSSSLTTTKPFSA